MLEGMATWAEVAAAAMALPEVEQTGEYEWRVRKKSIAWRRPLRKADLDGLAALGLPGYDGEILGVRTADLDAKEELLAADPDVFFTTPHFDGYPAVLVRLVEIDPADLPGLLTDAWLRQAPKTLVKKWAADHSATDA